MQNQITEQDTLPKGIWYEPARDRYRIRLYYRRKVVFRAYCADKPSALAALALGKQRRDAARTRQRPAVDISSPAALILSALAVTR